MTTFRTVLLLLASTEPPSEDGGESQNREFYAFAY